MKDYTIETTLVFTHQVEAETEKEALDAIRGTFLDAYNIEPSDDEMKIIAEESMG